MLNLISIGTHWCDIVVGFVFMIILHVFDKYWTNLNQYVLKCISGYANEVGEAFRPLIPKYLVNASYAVSISYALADCADKTYKEYTVNTLMDP